MDTGNMPSSARFRMKHNSPNYNKSAPSKTFNATRSKRWDSTLKILGAGIALDEQTRTSDKTIFHEEERTHRQA